MKKEKYSFWEKTKYNSRKISKSFGKYIPLIGIVLLFALNYQNSDKDVVVPFSERLVETLNELKNSIIIGDATYLLTTIILAITLWTGYKYWAKNFKPVRRNDELLHKLVFTGIVLLILMRHIKVASEIGKYLDIVIFVILFYLVVAGSWFIAKTIDGINLRSDLYCWGLRIVGAVIIFFGIILLFSSTLAISFSNTGLLLENIWWILSVCLILLGSFMQYRSFRNHPSIRVWS